MSLSDFLKKNLMNYFIIVTFVSVVIGTLGLIYEPNRSLGYEAFFSPLIFAAIGVMPSLVTYSKKELSIKQMVFRKGLQLLVLEILVLSFGYLMGAMKMKMMFSVALSVLVIFLLVHIIGWVLDSRDAVRLNESLKVFQGK